MALLRCPVCNAKGEVLVSDPRIRLRCVACGHSFLSEDGRSTDEHNIFADELPPFLADDTIEPGDLPLDPRWQTWITRLASHAGLQPCEVICHALLEFAERRGFNEPTPRS